MERIVYNRAALPVLSAFTTNLVKAELKFDLTPVDSLPCLESADGQSVSGDYAIATYICRRSGRDDLLGYFDVLCSAHCNQWIHASLTHNVTQLLEPLNKFLALRTFLAGESFTLADAAVLLNVQSIPVSTLPTNVNRWLSHLQSIPEIASAIAFAKGIEGRASKNLNASENINRKKVIDPNATGSLPDLEGAIDGAVMTRFPPEPSGYLHIGHVKACLLNEYYARKYKGKLLVRFDDTNPSKEKDEFEDAILNDLQTLGIKPDVISHTSDFFTQIQQFAEKAITDGLAYMDDTPQEKMQAERLEMKESSRRDSSPKENLALFKKLCEGDESVVSWCLRAKIDMSSSNGTMRDPVIYRMNLLPHHRTGTKFKAYPTYDFACPIVDSVEGVTHALRTTEYNDRDEQYKWFQENLKIRKNRIHAFARMSFVRTVLSKRKLTWFVSEGLVDGWFDPRFPTVQGVIRRGVSVAALRDFILSQGASRRTTTMQWDKFWAMNKAKYEPTAPRYMGVFKDDAVTLKLSNIPTCSSNECTAISVAVHPKDPSIGKRPLRIGNSVFIEGPDADNMNEGETITLMRWGNVKILRVEKDASGKVIRLEGAFDPTADFKGTRKLNWVADCADLVLAKLVEFDYLITKEKLEDGDDVKDFLNPVTKAETLALLDPCTRCLQRHDVVQLERRGFFRVDEPYGGSDESPAVLFMIPDGKTAAMSTLTSALKHV